MDYFLEIYGSLPRAGPGSDELTRRAFEMIPLLPESPRILDVGCGPGMQTFELLRSCAGTVVALDFLPEMIDRVNTEADRQGVSDRLETVAQDMKEMTFPASSFDVIWSEGAIYNLGFEAGLREIRRFVRPGGYVAVSEAVWLKPDPPTEAVVLAGLSRDRYRSREAGSHQAKWIRSAGPFCLPGQRVDRSVL